MLDTITRVSENAEAAVSHIYWLSGACERLEVRLNVLHALLVALLPYTPIRMREGLHVAGTDVFNSCEELADACGTVVTDYVNCLLLAQECAVGLPLLEGSRE